MKKHERKITKIGNSYGITFPKEFLKEAGLSYGDNVEMELKEGDIKLHKKEDVELPEGIDNNFMRTLNEVIEEHDVAFKGLVDK